MVRSTMATALTLLSSLSIAWAFTNCWCDFSDRRHDIQARAGATKNACGRAIAADPVRWQTNYLPGDTYCYYTYDEKPAGPGYDAFHDSCVAGTEYHHNVWCDVFDN
ncbi:unnamed protein product [Zymoseptoria tritici ST99CH_3D7]|uniref:Uncharacterized protein n=1 Tax=Zymoseptoria tritici (strain ST99CH_3D7) TaxID=1276538 RepID=A0A1X7SAC7_ZYMT9|nr:unnamed protein product [Zymoseptoria tritici ST99CH_3D7]